MENLFTLKETIDKFLKAHDAKLYGDKFIGFRAQLPNGQYLDSELGSIYEQYGCAEDCTEFNNICNSLKSGDYNW